MDDVLKKADELAKAIRGSDRFQGLQDAEKELAGDEVTSKLMAQYDELCRKLHDKEKNLEPVEVDEKHEQRDLGEKVKSNQLIQRLMRAQADYHEMMTKVSSIIESHLRPE